MTKRIVSGIFILAALGALGVILAGALTSGEQLIVRFLTAVIVAALGLYVISDLRLQTEESDEPGEARAPSVTPPSAPSNSTAAYMATVTNGYGADPSDAVRRNRPSEEPKPKRRPPARQSPPSVAVGSADHSRIPLAPSTSLDERFDSSARVVRTGPPPMPPADPTPMESVTAAPGGPASFDESHTTATAPIPITRWTAGTDQEDSGDPFDLSEVESTRPDPGDRHQTGDDDAPDQSSPAGSPSADPWPAPDASTSEGADDDLLVDGSHNDGPTYSQLDSSTYSGRLETSTSSWPAPEVDDGTGTPDSDDDTTPSKDENSTVSETAAHDSDDSAPTDVTDEVGDIGPRLRAVPDYQPDDGNHDSDHHPAATDDNTAISLDHDEAETDDDVVVMNDGVDEPVSVPVALVDGDGPETMSDQTPSNLDVAGDAVVAAPSADTRRTPMLDLRDRSIVEPEGVARAIEAGEYQVIETLIRQGMLSTVGPITDRDVRTMVYVAFTSNELRKLILAGGRPETERTDLDLGPVELFDERRFAPTPRTIYTLPDSALMESSPDGTEICEEASDSTPDPSTSDEPTAITMPAPPHLYRLDSDSSPETVA